MFVGLKTILKRDRTLIKEIKYFPSANWVRFYKVKFSPKGIPVHATDTQTGKDKEGAGEATPHGDTQLQNQFRSNSTEIKKVHVSPRLL